MTAFQPEQLDYNRSEDQTRDLKHRSTLTIPLRHCSLNLVDTKTVRISPEFIIIPNLVFTSFHKTVTSNEDIIMLCVYKWKEHYETVFSIWRHVLIYFTDILK